jgi:Trafficking protein particle complex subunit 10, TRAPPC10
MAAESGNGAELRATLEGLPVRVVDVNGVWPSLRIGRTVPLGRLEWLWTLRGASVRDSSTSAKACFNVTASAALSEPSSPQLVHEWFRLSYLHIMLVTIQELQLSRESPGWSRVRTFVDVCREHHLEYLVICVADDTAVRMQKKVLEKLRAEVNLATRGRERVVTVPTASAKEELKPISHLHHSPAHQDLLVRLRECARDGVEVRVQSYEGEAARSHAARSSAIWSFPSYFTLKEGMSFVFVQIGRRDLALKCYDELAAIMAERNERGTRGFCSAKSDGDTAMGVVDPYAKDFRRKIVDNDITELDFRTYLFACQISLLLVDRKYSEVAERGLKFITAVARRAAEESARDPTSLSPVFRDAWVFCAARALAAALAPAIPSSAAAANALSKQLGTARERHTARLIAGFHVHALKAFSGLAQLALPGTLVSVDASTDAAHLVSPELKDALAGMSNDMLRNALSEPAKAVELYSEMANAAASLYEMGGRARGAAALDGDAGVVRMRNNSLVEAEELLSAQCSRFTEDHGWDQLHRRRRVELASAEKSLERVQEYLVSCLTMLFMTRGRRRLGLTHDTQDGDVSFYASEAARWAREAQQAAGQLPRVMKYKAEKLFAVSLRPNKEHWIEGDPGSATVVIESDIPAELEVDSLHVELRLAALASDASVAETGRSAPAISALHRRGTLELGSGVTPSSGDEMSTASSTTSGDMPSESLVLHASGFVTVRPGTCFFDVSTPEVPRSGRYVVCQVSLVVGRLKLVQSAARAPTIPTVITKGASSAKFPSAALAASAAQADLPGSSKVRFPCYFADERPEAATVFVENVGRMYLLPALEQHVPIVVKAGPCGVEIGARLLLELCVYEGVSSAATKSFVEFVGEAAAGNDAIHPLLRVCLAEDSHCTGEVELTKAVEPNKSFRAMLPVRVVPTVAEAQGGAIDSLSVGIAVVLKTSLVCSELQSARTQKFMCTCDQRLAFVAPLHVSARLELSPGTDELPVSQVPGGDGDFETPLSGGGQLLCSLRSCAGEGKSVTLKSVNLALPPWLHIVEEESPPHLPLLPYRLRNNGVFSVAFGTTARLTMNSDCPNGQSTVALTRDGSIHHPRKSERTLSRLADQLDDVETGEDGLEQTEEAHSNEDALGIRAYGLDAMTSPLDLEVLTDGRRSMLGDDSDFRSDGAEIDAGDADGQKQSPEQIGISLEQIDVDSLSSRDNRDGSRAGQNAGSRRQRSTEGVVHLETTGRAGRMGGQESDGLEVSSLSSSCREPSSPTGPLLGGADAVLQLEVEVDGVTGVSFLEHAISVSGFRPHRRRYRIERSCPLTANVGQRIAFRFQVNARASSAAPYDDDPSESIVLHYELDTDDAEWMLIGRRRGQIVVSSREGDIGRASIIPLTAGRLFLPSVRLYERDGCPLSTTRYENVDSGSQVTCLPSTRVISLCSSEALDKLKLEALAGGGGMREQALTLTCSKVTTVAADSFFTN